MIEDIWGQDAFTVYNLSSAMMNLPVTPTMVGDMGVFEEVPINSNLFVLENQNGLLALIPNRERGEPGDVLSVEKREGRPYKTCHLPQNDSVLADDVTGVRAFGSETEMMQIEQKVNDKLQRMRRNIDVTREHLRVGALQGQIIDADGSTVIANLFTDFNVTRIEIDFLLGTAGTVVQTKCHELKRQTEAQLGAHSYSQPHILCGNEFFDKFVGHESVRDAYRYWSSNSWMREDVRAGFNFGGCVWHNYEPKVGAYSFLPTGDGVSFPGGTAGLFLEHFAPANYLETVGTRGQAYYARQEAMEMNKGAKLEAQSNPFPVCILPGTLIRCFSSN